MILLVALISLRTIKNGGDGIVTINRKTGEITIEKKDDCGTGFYIGHVIPYLMEHAKQGDYKKSVILAWY